MNQIIYYQDDKITVKHGKFGPYFSYQGENYSIFKTYNPDSLSTSDIDKIIEYKKKKSKSGASRKTNIPVKKNTEVKKKKKICKVKKVKKVKKSE